MIIQDLTDKQLETIKAHYRKAKKTEGGKYTLAEVLKEKLRRSGSVFSGKVVAAKILTQAQSSQDGLTTYGDLWDELYPDSKFSGHTSIKKIGRDLGAAVHYCIDHGLPIVTVLVVQKGNRKLSDEAVSNIFNDCRELGVNTGLVALDFIAQQKAKSLALHVSSLP